MADTYTIQSDDGSMALGRGRSVAAQSDGTLWAVCNYGDPTNGVTGDYIKVYYSTDNGVTWVLSTIISSADPNDSLGYASIAVDSNDYVHILYYYLDYQNGVGDPYYINHKVFDGTSWSANHTIATSVIGIYYTFVVDKDDKLYCFFTGQDGTDGKLYYRVSDDAGSTWSASNVTADTAGDNDQSTGYPVACVDIDGKIYIAWECRGNYGAGHSWNGNIRLAIKAYGGAWSGEWATSYDYADAHTQHTLSVVVSSVTNPVVYVLYQHKHDGGYYYPTCAIRDTGGAWTIEAIVSRRVTNNGNGLVLDRAGVLRFVGMTQNTAGSEKEYRHAYRTGADTWVDSGSFHTCLTGIDGLGNGVSPMWAMYPQVGGISSNIPASGFVAAYRSDVKDIDYYKDAVLAVTHFPSDAQTRVASIIHRYNRGIYNMELCLGEVIADFGIPSVDTEAQKSYYGAGYVSQIPRGYGYVSQPPVCPPGTVPKWTWEEGWTCVASPFAGAEGTGAAGTPHYGAGYVSQAPSCPVGTFPKWTANGWICAPSIPPTSGWTTPPLSGIYPSTEKDITPGSLYIPPEVYSTTPAQEAAKEAFKGTTAKATVGTSSSPPSCPAGTIPRYIDGKWKCVPHDPGTTAGGGYAR